MLLWLVATFIIAGGSYATEKMRDRHTSLQELAQLDEALSAFGGRDGDPDGARLDLGARFRIRAPRFASRTIALDHVEVALGALGSVCARHVQATSLTRGFGGQQDSALSSCGAQEGQSKRNQ